MGQQYTEIQDKHVTFIGEQKIYFVGTATADSKINLSPKGHDSLRILGPNRVVWLNVTGSGNETSAHVQADGRMTIMFAAFEGKPITLRLYGQASVIHQSDPEWRTLLDLFPATPGTRQIFDLTIELVQQSCGMSVPFYDYRGDRQLLNDWAKKKGDTGIKEYWGAKNQTSLDGVATRIIEKNS